MKAETQSWSAARSVLDQLRAAGLFPPTISQPEREPELARQLMERLRSTDEPATDAEVAARQQALLAETVTEAVEHTRYYAEVLPPSVRQGAPRIEQIPFLTRATLQSSWEAMISDRHRRRRMSKKVTSGTSGMPVTIFQAEEEAYSTLHYDLARTCRLAGFPALERWESPYVLAVTDNPGHTPFGTYNPLLDKWCRFEVIDPLVPESIAAVLDLLDRLEPALLVSRPTALRLLVEHAAGRRRPPDLPLGVVSSGDNFHSDERERVAAAFQAQVVDLFAISECSGVASLCREGGRYHVHWELALVEVVDPSSGRPREDEEPGEIVVTDLSRRAMPILRYRTSDWGRRAAAPCPCGRPGPTLLSIDGREGCYFRLSGGRRLNPSRLNAPLGHLPGVKQFRLTQTGIGELRMELISDGGDASGLEALVRAVLAEQIPEPMTLRLDWVDRLGAPGAKVQRYACLL